MESPSLVEIRFLDSATRHGSFSAAARELGVTQQAVSARVRGLERRIGIPLLHRSPAGVAPTAAGEAVLAWGREVLAVVDRLDEGIASLRGQTAPSLAVGASQTIAGHLLPGWLLALRRRQSEAGRSPTDISLRAANSEEVVAMVRGGSIELGFIETPKLPGDLGSVTVSTDRMVAAVGPGHPWARRPSVSLAELGETALVAREPGSGTRDAFELAVRERLGRGPHSPAMVLATEAALRSAVAQGVAPAVVSELTVEDDVRLGRIRALPIAPDPIARPFSAIWRGSRHDLAGAKRELVSIASASRDGGRGNVVA